MKDPRVAQIRAKVTGQPVPEKIPKRPPVLGLEKTKLERLKKLRKAERPSRNPLSEVVEHLESERTTPRIVEVNPVEVQSAIARLDLEFRSKLQRNQKVREIGELELKQLADGKYRIREKARLLTDQLADVAELQIKTKDLWNKTVRDNSSLSLQKAQLESEKRRWQAQLPTLTAQIRLKREELEGLHIKQTLSKSDLSKTQNDIDAAKLRLSLIHADTEEAKQLQKQIDNDKIRVRELRETLGQLETDKGMRSIELQNALSAKARVSDEVGKLASQKVVKADEIAEMGKAVDSAQTLLKSLQVASSDISARAVKTIRQALARKMAIEDEAKGIIPKLKAQLEVTKTLQSTLNTEIAKSKWQQKLLMRAIDSYDKATFDQILSESAHRKARSTFDTLISRLQTLISEANEKSEQFIGKILLLEPMFQSIANAQSRLANDIAYNQAENQANERERKALAKEKTRLEKWNLKLNDREMTLKKAKQEIYGK